MKVLLLSPYPEMLIPALELEGDSCVEETDFARINRMDWIICFGHRKIIREPYLSIYGPRIINIHIGFLPWNRGADPNFWSWFDDTPKGVTIHQIDAGIDTGNIIVQQELAKWYRHETLSSSWLHLMTEAKKLFEDNWRNIRREGLPTRKADGAGTYHRSADKTEHFSKLPLAWDTPVKDVVKLGKEFRAQKRKEKDRHPRPRKHRQQTLPEL
jgi:methionyl-tRNA formyltransferase